MVKSSSGFLKRPTTRPSWWAVGLAITFLVMNIVNSAVFMRLPEDVSWRHTVLPFYGISMILCGLAPLVLALIAIIRNNERSWLVWFTLVPGVSTFLFNLGEFLVPH